jgi:hypothetical protein
VIRTRLNASETFLLIVVIKTLPTTYTIAPRSRVGLGRLVYVIMYPVDMPAIDPTALGTARRRPEVVGEVSITA